MKKILALILLLISAISFIVIFSGLDTRASGQVLSTRVKPAYWFMLYRKSNLEFLYHGHAGDLRASRLIKTFSVKTGIPGERPTPLPQFLGRNFWLVTAKSESIDFETAPYFISLDIPVSGEEPYGPDPYLECNGQCNWILPGEFGLHGVAGDDSKLSSDNPGSSGCIRHKDADITYLYHLLDPENEEIRYYIQDL
jgi:hypothetical protein